MTTPSIGLQDLRRRIYVKAKAEVSWRFWGLYVHVCKVETLTEAYRLAKKNKGAPGIDGVTFAAIEAQGVAGFLDELREELVQQTYRPQGVRKVGIPKGRDKVRVLSIPTVRDRVVQGALKLILEAIFEADFQSGSFGYRPKKSPHDANNASRMRSSRGRPTSSILICAPTSTRFVTISCWRRWPGESTTVRSFTCSR